MSNIVSSHLEEEVKKRRTFAIISHPDAGKTTMTEKILLWGQQIQKAGTVKGRGSDRHATSDWMAMEKERGISVTTSVMQFPYKDNIVNLLDTPGHADFSEDTYRTLTAVDCALMVIDGAKGVEERTIKLMEVCRLRDTPIITFVNKMDRDIRDPIEVLDEIESVLKIKCAPINWPIGMGKLFKGVYNIDKDESILYQTGHGHEIIELERVQGIDNPELDAKTNDLAEDLREELELVQGASYPFELDGFRKGELTPVFFGTALGNFGVDQMLDGLLDWAPAPETREARERTVESTESKFTGFVFKIQANMDPRHRDRIAFMRVCSGQYEKGIKLKHVRTGKDMKIPEALTFLAGEREHLAEAWPGDIIGLHNHGSIQIGDTFTQGEELNFKGIPNFAPELFRRIVLKDPLKSKQLRKGLKELAEEGAAQVFFPQKNNDIIIGAVGILQFDVLAHRLKHEYKVDADYAPVGVNTARWVHPKSDSEEDVKKFEEFKKKAYEHLSLDYGDYYTYIAPTRVNLSLMQDRWPDVVFSATREH